MLSITEDAMSMFLSATRFAADKHRDQRRKDIRAAPYINHPIEVTETLWRIGEVRDPIILVSAMLHDTIEDTDTTQQEISTLFGVEVAALVLEVTDDKRLPKMERKRLQIDTAPDKSSRAKMLKIADKICNIQDMMVSPSKDWSLQRRQDYLDWAEKVVCGLQGANAKLDVYFEHLLAQAKIRIGATV